MILDEQSRAMLDLMIQSEPDGCHRSFSFPHLRSLSHWTEEEVSSVISSLVGKGLASYAYTEQECFHDGHVSKNQEIAGACLTQDGRKYKELMHLERIERWKERLFGFVSGVLVTVFGGVILSLLAG